MNKLIFEQNYNHLLGLFNKKDFREFEEKFKQLDSIQILCEKSYNLFGLYLSNLKKYDQSIYYFCKSLSINSEFIQSKINLAGVYFLTGKTKQSKKLLEESLDKDHQNKMALFLSAEIYGVESNFNSVKEVFKKIEDAFPVDFQSYYKCALFYYKNSLYSEAEPYFRKAIQLNNNISEVKYYFARNLKNLSKFKEAIEFLELAIKHHKNDKNLYYSLADIYRGLGDFENSNKVLKNILKLFDENDPKCISHLIVSLKDPVEKDFFVKKAEDEYDLSNSHFKERVGYALFKYHDTLKNYKKASRYLTTALELTEKNSKYDYDIEKKQFNFLKDCFGYEYFNGFLKTRKPLDLKDKVNIFIIGLHRSGSTLLEQILSTNSEFSSYGEAPYFADIITKKFPDQSLNSFKNEIYKTDSEKFLSIGKEYNLKLNLNSKFSLDKMLSNFRMLGFISKSIPNSIFVHIQRNKNDNLFSILSNFYENKEALWSYNIENLLKYYDDYKNLIEHWKKFLSHRIVDIQYEEMISNPEKEISKLLKILNLKWSNDYLNYTKNKNIVETASVYQVRDKLYNSSIDKWKNYQPYFHDLFK